MEAFDEHLAEMMQDPKFAREYDALQPERELMMAACPGHVRFDHTDWQQFLFNGLSMVEQHQAAAEHESDNPPNLDRTEA